MKEEEKERTDIFHEKQRQLSKKKKKTLLKFFFGEFKFIALVQKQSQVKLRYSTCPNLLLTQRKICTKLKGK